jgi:hypothetical protein
MNGLIKSSHYHKKNPCERIENSQGKTQKAALVRERCFVLEK